MSNTLLRHVCLAMEKIAPLRLAERWDNVGLLLESPVHKPNRKRVLLTIDLTQSVLSESLEKEASVIVAYHPTIFKGLQSFTLANPLQASLLKCAAEGISVYSPHSALDSVWGGINDWLAGGLVRSKEDGEVRSLVGEKLHPTNGLSEGGDGRLVTLHEPIGFEKLVERLSFHLIDFSYFLMGTPCLPRHHGAARVVQVGYPANSESRSYSVRTIAICAGSGGSMLGGKEADVYLTGEMSHHEVLAAVAAGKHVIICGHDNTERGYLPVLANKLRSELRSSPVNGQGLAEVEVVVSEADKHPLQIV
ncbi:NGG1p interacting factor 3 [Macrolepiota fuliginosa MF-IS2]|uniref:NGG1p interacting factor 3 n=1 Tax=Macrolepiota fuliginosa MF-IS2 TaxID=1400762 RepID=A0A9P5XBU8_9AGAR|nr:NGG1p interacting factor 3 [Macrolepiota fuliginosa MF-IS2]